MSVNASDESVEYMQVDHKHGHNTLITPYRIGLGGGCHWCTEGVFLHLRGVSRVEQGWIASEPPHDNFSEAVIVHFDPAVVSAADLIRVHTETHSARSDHPLRGRYRSAVYYFAEEEAKRYRSVLAEIGDEAPAGEKLCTRVLAHRAFTASLPEHRDYYRTDPERPFCRRYISPKLTELRRRHPRLMKDND